MIRTILILSFFVFSSTLVFSQGRLESEYKLAVPNDEVQTIWTYLQNSYVNEDISIGDLVLKGISAKEIFIDKYFDAADERFAKAEISLRHRKRFKDGKLIKELIQLKTPYSEDKVIRNEIKFEVNTKRKLNDISSRHPFLKFLNNAETERMKHQLAAFKINANQIDASLKLTQTRKRAYIKDLNNESVATITLDKVSNFSFPFQSFVELELELNEILYTEADENERAKLRGLNESIKEKLFENFPNLQVDQRSKYIKMKKCIEENMISFLYENVMWLFFGLIVFISSALFIKDQLS